MTIVPADIFQFSQRVLRRSPFEDYRKAVCRRSNQNQPVMVELKPATFFCLNRAGIFWQEVILHWGLIHRKASEHSGFEVVLFGWSYFGV